MRKINSFIVSLFMFFMIIQSAAAQQQQAEAFAQPYALGEPFASEHFTGKVWLARLSKVDTLNVPLINVTFAPGCINDWHYHTGGQLLIVGAGKGYYQEEGKPARLLHAGDIVEIAPNVVHWHGAAPGCWFSHVAVGTNPSNNSTVWLRPVGDSAYRAAVAESLKPAAELDRQLSARQIAIVSVGATTGAGDLEALRESLIGALNAGMTQNEIKEILIQSYAYSGFPRAIRAIQTFMQVIDERKAKGISDAEGKEASPAIAEESKYQRGAEILARLTGVKPTEEKTGFAAFAPGIDTFLKEHLFCDIFERGVLSFNERELATVSIIAGVGGVEPMAKSHMAICLRLGWTEKQIAALLNRVGLILGEDRVKNLRK